MKRTGRQSTNVDARESGFLSDTLPAIGNKLSEAFNNLTGLDALGIQRMPATDKMIEGMNRLGSRRTTTVPGNQHYAPPNLKMGLMRANQPGRKRGFDPDADPNMQTRPGEYYESRDRSKRAPLSKFQQLDATPRLETRTVTPLSRQRQNFETEQGLTAPFGRYGGLLAPENERTRTGLMNVSSKSKGKGKGKNKGGGLSFAQRAAAIRQVANDINDAGMHVTDTVRSASSSLGRRNPKSLHIQAMAFDTRAKTPAQADAVMAQQRAVFAKKGLVEGRDYKFLDEVRNPSAWATAPHVHTQFTAAGLARYQGLTQPDAATNVAANVPTPTARPSLPGDETFADPRSTKAEASPGGGLRPGFRTAMGGAAAQGAFQRAVGGLLGQPETAAAPTGGLRPGFTGSSLAPSFAAPSPGTIGGLLGRPSADLGFMPGSGTLAPSSTGSLRSRSPAPSPESDKAGRLGASPEPPDPDRFGGPSEPSPDRFGPPSTDAGIPAAETANERSFAPSPFGLPTHAFTPSGLPDTAPAPTLADRAARESITSSLPDQGPTLADRPNAARTVAATQPAATALDAIKTNFDEDTTPVKDVVDHPVHAVAQAATPEVTDDTGAYPPEPPEHKRTISELFDYGAGLAAKKAATGLLGGGLPGALFGGLGSLISQNMPSGFNEAVPESSRFSVGSGLSGINAALSGPKGATATSRSNPGMSVTSLGNGQSLRRSDRFGWTEVVGPDGSVQGIQYDDPTGKGILGKGILGQHQGLFGWASNKAGSTFGGSNGLSPSASRAIRGGTAGGLY